MFEGTYTALITPFKKNGEIDYSQLRELVEFQVTEGVDGLVPAGTTGESPTLNFEEHKKVIETVIESADGRVRVIAGTGGNSTAEALELTRHALATGATGTLQVTPYYNKPSREGLLQHFHAVADVGLPVVLYNIPGRTGRELPLDLVAELAKHPHIKAVKEASGDVDRVSRYAYACDIETLSGDDPLTLPMMIAGATGVISVASNIIPQAVTEMTHHALEGRWEEARELHRHYYEIFTGLFMETNPIPVKAALSLMGKTEEAYRLPLCPMSREQKSTLEASLRKAGIR